MYKKLFVVFGCLFISLLQASSNTVVVGTNDEFPPFSYIENEVLVGFDIDIAKEVVKRLGKEIQFKNMPFDVLIPDIVLGNVDFVAAGMSATDERAKRVLFTQSYISEDPLVILSQAKKKMDLDDLYGKTVVVIEGFTADMYMSQKSDVNLIRLPTQADGFLAIKSGRADAFVTAKSTVESFFAVQDASQYYFKTIEGTGETCSLIVPKNRHEMFIQIEKTLDDMRQDGTLEKLKTKWNLK